MARVVLPLLGVEATGKLGNAIVYMPIGHAKDGLTSVRMWTKPSNPQSESQGDVRLKMKAVGHGVTKIVNDASLQVQIKAKTPAGQIWNAFFVGTALGSALADIDASLVAWDTAVNTTDWQSAAASLGLIDQDITYASIAPITAGEVLFVHARAAYDLLISLAPYDAQLLSTADIISFADAYLT